MNVCFCVCVCVRECSYFMFVFICGKRVQCLSIYWKEESGEYYQLILFFVFVCVCTYVFHSKSQPGCLRCVNASAHAHISLNDETWVCVCVLHWMAVWVHQVRRCIWRITSPLAHRESVERASAMQLTRQATPSLTHRLSALLMGTYPIPIFSP